MQKIRLLDRGPNGQYRRGQVVEVDDMRAAVLIEGGHAQPADKTEPEPEEVTDGERPDEL